MSEPNKPGYFDVVERKGTDSSTCVRDVKTRLKPKKTSDVAKAAGTADANILETRARPLRKSVSTLKPPFLNSESK